MKTSHKVSSLILAVLLIVIAIGNVFAWFSAESAKITIEGASAGAYFKGGTGSEEDPYTLGNYRHLYNLAWLQNTGRIPDGTYFALDPDEDNVLSMKDENGKTVIVPPIGTQTNPFNSIFDGKGCIISNLVVSTNKDVLYGNPADENYVFANSVGMFGMTGTSSEITNFILDNPTVEVSNKHEAYSKDPDDPAAVGLAIGYVANKASSIGVIGGTLAVRKTGYTTVNSIVGAINPTVSEDNNITGGVGGSGSHYGSSFDVELFLDRLLLMYDNNQNYGSWRLPEIDYNSYTGKTGSKFPYPKNQDVIIPFTVTEESTYDSADSKEVISSQNMGYFVGSQNKINRKQITFFHDKKYTAKDENGDTYYLEKLINAEGENPSSGSWTSWTLPDGTSPLEAKTTPKWLYTNTNAIVQGGNSYAPASGFRPLTDEEFNALPDGIKNLIVDDDDAPTDNKVDHMTIKFSNMYYLSGENTVGHSLGGAWGYYGQISWMGKTYMKGFRDSDGYVVNEEGGTDNDMLDTWGNRIKYSSYTGGVYLPNNAIWFKPARAGKIRFVVYADDLNETFMLAKITRTGVTKENKDINPFYSDPTLTGEDGDIKIEPIMAQNISSPYVLMYYEYDVTQAEIDAGNVEYFLVGYNQSGAYFVYLDIGSSAAGEVPSTGVADPTKSITAIDFIYKGVTITQEDVTGTDITKGSFVKNNALYAETGTMISFGGSGALVYFYHRNESGDVFSVGYFGSNQPTGSVANKFVPVTGLDDIDITKDYESVAWTP